MEPTTFALFFGNRGFFPETLIAGARREMQDIVERSGYRTLLLELNATRFGAVETVEEGRRFSKFLEANWGKYHGVILSLPNFGDETGAVAALQDAGVPILIHAWPDEIDKMDSAHRRDAFCGKFSVMDVFCQYGIPFTTFPPHTVAPDSVVFKQRLDLFAGVCRITSRMKRLTIGMIGARTTPFKTIRFDELALQHYGVTTETFDLAEVFLRFRDVDRDSSPYRNKAEHLKDYACWEGVSEETFSRLVKLAVVLDDMIQEYNMDAIAVRCWLELEKELGVSPCVILSDLNNRGIPAACETDVCNALVMTGLSLASGKPAACLDWNNNYGDDPDKCILFHCGPVPQALMKSKGKIVDHPMFSKAIGPGRSFGCNTGRIAKSPFTFSSSKTQDGRIFFYLGEGEFTDDPIPEEFFGCAGVAHIGDLQKKLEIIGRQGYRHHVSVTTGNVSLSVHEAFTRYLNYETTAL
jgi:L-fucose isomerase-like protein